MRRLALVASLLGTAVFGVPGSSVACDAECSTHLNMFEVTVHAFWTWPSTNDWYWCDEDCHGEERISVCWDPHEVCVDDDEVVTALEDRDVSALIALVNYSEYLVVNRDRGTLQVRACNDAVLANIPLSDTQAAYLAAVHAGDG